MPRRGGANMATPARRRCGPGPESPEGREAVKAMATLIPESCPARATTGERRVFGLLRGGLPDDFTAWFEPLVRNRHPDFALLGPDFGLLVLEVKGWYPGQIARATDHDIELSKAEGGETKVEMHMHPRLQARDYVLAAVNELKRPEFAILH